MINKLRAAFTRAKVNHPRKLIYGTPNAVAVMLIPFDGGITFAITSGSSIGLAGSQLFFTKLDKDTADPLPVNDLDDYKYAAVIEHLGKKYHANVAQREAYDKRERRINKIKNQFSYASQDHRKTLQKQAQKLADQQQWIIDGLKQVTDENPLETQTELNIDRGRTTRKTKKPGN